jgi:deoxyribodipyrimidine photo-lyase
VGYNQARLRRLNEARTATGGDYVLYWMQIYRRLERNHALDYALRCAGELGKPLVVYEGLRIDYPWASRRLHRFVLEGMQANAARAAELGLNYWPFVETEKGQGRGLLRRLSERACLVVTDDYPCFIVPPQAEALARGASFPVFCVDSNSVVPLSLLGPAVSAAAHLRPRIHKAFAAAWPHRATAKPRVPDVATKRVRAPFDSWKAKDVAAFVDALPLDPTVVPVARMPGGTPAARARLREFLKKRLRGYAEVRSEPRAPAEGHASGLSPYLHFGHVSIEEVVEAALATTGKWSPDEFRLHNRGKREGFFCDDPDVNSFLDEALTWRDVGFQWHWSRRADAASLETALPAWALQTLGAHAADPRPWRYAADELENGATHDPLWNAAQRELRESGVIQNYLRMLWGKKILEWSRNPADAFDIMIELNNRYALDGRDPNSYTGIAWVLGRFDRGWPERAVYGKVRSMSSASTRRKLRLDAWLQRWGTSAEPPA